MQSLRAIQPISWGLALAVFALGVAYLALCLVYAHYYPRSFSQVRRCLLKSTFVIYTFVSAAFITAFFTTRRVSRTDAPAFALFCTWEIFNGLCLGAEIIYLWFFIIPFQGVWILVFAVGCVGLPMAAILGAGIWCYWAIQREWLWIFIPILCGVFTITSACLTNNDVAPAHARYQRHWFYLALPVLPGLGLGLAAAILPVEQEPLLQHVQYVCQSVVGFLVVYAIQVMGLVSDHRSKTRAKEVSQAPRCEKHSLRSVKSLRGLIPEIASLEDLNTADLESLLTEEGLTIHVKVEGGKPRPDSSTLTEII